MTENLKISRSWAMPNSKTFDIKPIKELILKYKCERSVDPFARDSKLCKVTNDLDPSTSARYHLDALVFLKKFKSESVGFVLFDPPYSPRQVSECYKKLGMTVTMQDTQSSFWSKLKKEISRILKPNGVVITFGWCSNGIGKTNGFKIEEILIVAHGGWHNDTICTVERKTI